LGKKEKKNTFISRAVKNPEQYQIFLVIPKGLGAVYLENCG